MSTQADTGDACTVCLGLGKVADPAQNYRIAEPGDEPKTLECAACKGTGRKDHEPR